MSGSRVYNTPYMVTLQYPLNLSCNGGFTPMLFLRLDQAIQLEKAAKNLKERLAVRYALYNGLSSGEIASARIEHLDPVECTLFMPWRHWKKNQICDIDPETVRLQAEYSEPRVKGPLLRSNKGGHYTREGVYYLIQRVAKRTDIPNRKGISPRTLKRTFCREWLLAGGTVGSLQKQLGHKHLWSTAHYLRFVLKDVQVNHKRFMNHVNGVRRTLAP